MTERNEKCPCGSGKKYKQCFLAVNSTCKDFIETKNLNFINDHPSRNKKVFQFFTQAIEDINTAFRKDDKNRDIVASRVQMVTIFTFIDIMASYWFEYLGKTGTQQERFLGWFSKYCLTTDNKEYKDNTEMKKITAPRAYSFRNSMVHFFGLSGFEEDKYMLLATNDRPEIEVEELKKRLKKKSRAVVITKSEEWHRLITSGAMLMLEEMQNDIDKSQTDEATAYAHVHGIDRIFQKTQKEGAVKIPANEVKEGVPFK
ncbi:MAG: SEC-C domain-containing protein [Patescibacteria group bacterium]